MVTAVDDDAFAWATVIELNVTAGSTMYVDGSERSSRWRRSTERLRTCAIDQCVPRGVMS
jgi:hypothetical protein